MATETTSTSITELTNSEVIADVIIQAASDATVISPLSRVLDLAGKQSSVASFPQWELDAVSSLSEAGTLSNVELQTTEVATISAAQVGILREVTDFAVAVGPDNLMDFVTGDGARLCILELENSLASRFAGFGTTVGTTTVDMSIANYVEAISKMGTQNARGRIVGVWDDQQAFDLRAAVAASSGAVFANAGNPQQTILNANTSGFIGELFGVPNWVTNLTDTANAGADVVGSMFIDGNTNPDFAGLGIALLWMPRIKQVSLAAEVAEQVAITMAFGTGRISDFGVDVTTDA